MVLAGLVASTSEVSAVDVELLPLVSPDLEHLEGAVADQLRETQELLQSILDRPGTGRQELAESFGAAGRLYHAYDLSDPAATCYANAGRLAPGDFQWAYLKAILDQKAGRLEDAVTGFLRTVELEPGALPAMVHLGDTYLSLRDLEQARHWLERALELDPSTAAAKASLGQIALSEKQYRRAVDHLEAALNLVPAATRLHHPLGLAYRGLGDMDKARHHLGLRGAVGVRVPDPLIEGLAELKVGERVFLLRGRVAFRAGHYEAAVEAFRSALDAAPESIRARVNLASALAQAGRRDEAILIFEQVLELDPENAAARFNLGVLRVQIGDYPRAAEALRVAVELRPDDAVAYLELARVQARLGRWNEALGAAVRASELDPASEGSRLVAVQALMSLNRHVEAHQRLEEAYTLMPEAGNIVAALSRLLASSPELSHRDGARALDLALRVFGVTKSPRHAEAVAMAYAETGRCDDAVRWQRQAFEAAQKGQVDELAQSLRETLTLLEKRPCRLPGRGGP